jgi:hypothetical protein
MQMRNCGTLPHFHDSHLFRHLQRVVRAFAIHEILPMLNQLTQVSRLRALRLRRGMRKNAKRTKKGIMTRSVLLFVVFMFFVYVFVCSGLSVRGIPLTERSPQVDAPTVLPFIQRSTFEVRIAGLPR